MVLEDAYDGVYQLAHNPLLALAFSGLVHVFFFVTKKIGPDWFSRFDVYWIQTYKHPRQTDKLNLYIDCIKSAY